MDVQIEESWKTELAHEFRQPYFEHLAMHLKTEKALGTIIFPPGNLIFNAFAKTPFQRVKAVIIGQDPYHGYGQAMGLSFSVPRGVNPPPSLLNIFRELREDTGLTPPRHGDLTSWAEQGVLMLNASLTVRAAEPNSHSQIGWQAFTNAAIKKLSDEREHIVFLLWGRNAINKRELVDETRHLVLTAAHPSPLSAYNGFFGCRHFTKANEYLVKNGIDPINWLIN